MAMNKTFAIAAAALTLACNRARTVPPSANPPEPAQAQAPPPSSSPPAPSAATEPMRRSWTFDADPVGRPPAGFSFGRTGNGPRGRWLIRADGGTNVLAQLDTDDTDFRFPLAVADEPELRDVRVSVRCKPVSGKVDQACGLVARYRDDDDYLLTRANALEGNIRLYVVEGGKRKEIANHRVVVTVNVWHDYRLDVTADRIEVFWDGRRVIEQRDDTFPDAGRVGVWTKADSVTYFDDLSAEAL
jgi:hypothetical protein